MSHPRPGEKYLRQKQAEIAASQARSQARNDRRVASPRKIAEIQPKKKKYNPPRLPDGATFWARFDAASMIWSGDLTVNNIVYSATASTVFGLMTKLDKIYRQKMNDLPSVDTGPLQA